VAFAVVIVMGGGALLLLAATVGLVLLVTRGSVPSPSEAAAAARRHGTVVNVTAWVVAVVLAPLALTVVSGLAFPDDARAFTAALVGAYPAIVGLAYLGVHAVGERTWPRPAGPVRRAALVHRRVADVAPAWARRTLHGLVAAALAVLVTGGLTAAPDGRSIAVERYVGDMYAAHTASPYPGWDFAVPLLVAVAAARDRRRRPGLRRRLPPALGAARAPRGDPRDRLHPRRRAVRRRRRPAGRRAPCAGRRLDRPRPPRRPRLARPRGGARPARAGHRSGPRGPDAGRRRDQERLT